MGVSYYTYVGPYVKVYNPEKASKKEYHSCPNHGCSNNKKPMSDAYCSKCGTKIERLTFYIQDRTRFDANSEFADGTLRDVYSDFDDHNYMHFVDDGQRDLLHLLMNINNGDFVSDLTDKNPATEVEEFKEIRRKEIARLKEVFGEENVSVRWGVINYVC